MFDETIINNVKYYVGGHIEGVMHIDDIIAFLELLQIDVENIYISDLNDEKELYENIEYTFIRNESIKNIRQFITMRNIWKKIKDINNKVLILWPIIKI